MTTQIDRAWARTAILVAVGVVVIAGGWWLIGRGIYGLALFVVIPVVMGALSRMRT